MAVRELSDAELIGSARKGDSDAYGELYRRHVDSARAAARALTRSRADADDVTSEAFARVLRALQAGGGPDVSFRPYLVTSVRNVFYDRVRRNREEPTDDLSDEVNVALLDSARSQEDGAFAAAAFATLPERWQLVLWHTEVEGRSVAEVAPLLGLAPNAVAALAYRAREGLRQAYLQAHLRDQHAAECRDCAANLGAYVRDGLSARDRRRVDAHLDGCESCTRLMGELTDTNNTLRSALIPALIGVSSTAYLSNLGGKGVLGWVTRASKPQRALAGGTVAAGVLVAAAVLLAAFGGRDESQVAAAAATTVVARSAGTGATGADDQPVDSSLPTTVPAASRPSTSRPSTSVPSAGAPNPPTFTTAPAPGSTATLPAATSPPTPGGTAPRNTPRVSPTTPSTPTGPTPSNPSAQVPTTVATPVPTTVTVPSPTTTQAAATTTQAPPPPALSAVAMQRTVAVANGQVRVQVTVANTGNSTANGVRVDLPAPTGAALFRSLGVATPAASLVSAYGSGWTCNSTGSCTLLALAAGQSSVLQLTFALSPSVGSSITFTPTISAPVGAAVSTTPVTVAVGAVNGLLAAETERGAVVAIGNSVTTCADTDPACALARTGAGDMLNHLDFAMQHVNTAGGVFNSSTAALSMSGTVSRAFLTWSGDVAQGTPAAPNPAARNTVTFTTPAGVSTVVADQLKDNSGGTYFAIAEVTSLVTGSGTYAVADIQTALGQQSFGGWSLVVITHDASLPERFLMVTAPQQVVTSTASSSFTVNLLQPASTATLVAVAFEGDRLFASDKLSLSGFSLSNAFRGSVPAPRSPAYDNTLGTDVLVASVTGMSGVQLSFNAVTSDDQVMLAAVAVAVDV